jgi:hypothetical protein
MRKTSVYLDDAQAARLNRLAAQEGRSQAEILRARGGRLRAAGVARSELRSRSWIRRIDDDPRPLSQTPEDELRDGFGA